MPTISLRAIKGNKHLHGTEISLRESIAASCGSTYHPFTDDSLTVIGERIGMSLPQTSRTIKTLIEKKEIAMIGGRIYLLRLDDFQLKTIRENDEKNGTDLIDKLAEAGCLDARNFVDDASTNVDFLLHFFLFAQLTGSQQMLTSRQPIVDTSSTNIDTSSTPYKELNGNVLNTNENVQEEEGKPPLPPPDFKLPKFPQEAQGAERKNGKLIAQEAQGAESDKTRQIDEAELRPDIAGMADWLEYLGGLPKYKGIEMVGFLRKMRGKTKGQVNRKRILIWLLTEIRDVPVDLDFLDESPPPPDVGKTSDGKPLDDAGRQSALAQLADFADDADALRSFEKYYQPADWLWLTGELEKSYANTG